MHDFRPNQPLPGHQARRRHPYARPAWRRLGIGLAILAALTVAVLMAGCDTAESNGPVIVPLETGYFPLEDSIIVTLSSSWNQASPRSSPPSLPDTTWQPWHETP